MPDEEQVKLLMELCDSSSEDKVKAQCIGTLGCLAQYPSALDANRVRLFLFLFLFYPRLSKITSRAGDRHVFARDCDGTTGGDADRGEAAGGVGDD